MQQQKCIWERDEETREGKRDWLFMPFFVLVPCAQSEERLTKTIHFATWVGMTFDMCRVESLSGGFLGLGNNQISNM
jgi:hypothetical protein